MIGGTLAHPVIVRHSFVLRHPAKGVPATVKDWSNHLAMVAEAKGLQVDHCFNCLMVVVA